ncbi:hypothetical protein FQN60_017114, partial [Etheostoma spectabile]
MAHNIEREKEAEGGRDVGESCIAPGWHKLDAQPPHRHPEIPIGAKLWPQSNSQPVTHSLGLAVRVRGREGLGGERRTDRAPGERREINNNWEMERASERLWGVGEGAEQEKERERWGYRERQRLFAPLGAWVRAARGRSWHAAGRTVAESLRQAVCSPCLPSESRGRREREVYTVLPFCLSLFGLPALRRPKLCQFALRWKNHKHHPQPRETMAVR